MKKIIVIILCLCCLIGFSQSVSTIDMLQIRMKALEVFKSYSDKIERLNVYSDKDDFINLFDSKTQIYNDILYDNQPQFISPKDYCNKFKRNILLSSKISNWELGYPYKHDEKWNVNIKFEKEINVRFENCSELSYPSKSFKYEMIIAMDKNPNYKENLELDVYDVEDKIPFINAKIISLNVINPINYFCIVKINDINLLKSQYKKEIVEFSSLHQLVELNQNVSNVKEELFLIGYDEDYRISVKRDTCSNKFYDFKVRPLNSFFGVNFSYSPRQFGIVSEKHQDIVLNTCNSSISFVYKHKIFGAMNGAKYYLGVRPGYSFDYFNFKGSHNMSFLTKDIDNDQYLRKVNLSEIDEKDFFHNFDIPISFGLVRSINGVSLIMDVGLWMNFIFFQTHESKLNAYYSGLYSQYCNVEIAENGYYDFGMHSLSKKEQLDLNFSKIDYGAFCSIGAMCKLPNYFYLSTNIEYRHGNNDRSVFNEDFFKLFQNEEYVPFYSTVKKWSTNNVIVNISILKKF